MSASYRAKAARATVTSSKKQNKKTNTENHFIPKTDDYPTRTSPPIVLLRYHAKMQTSSVHQPITWTATQSKEDFRFKVRANFITRGHGIVSPLNVQKETRDEQSNSCALWTTAQEKKFS